MKKDELLLTAKKILGDRYDLDPQDLKLTSLRSNETIYSFHFTIGETILYITIDDKGNLIDAFKFKIAAKRLRSLLMTIDYLCMITSRMSAFFMSSLIIGRI